MVKHSKSCPNIVYFHKNKVLNIFGQKRQGKLIESNDYVCTQKEGGGRRARGEFAQFLHVIISRVSFQFYFE